MKGLHTLQVYNEKKGSKTVAASGKGEKAALTGMFTSDGAGIVLPKLAIVSSKTNQSLVRWVQGNDFEYVEGGHRELTGKGTLGARRTVFVPQPPGSKEQVYADIPPSTAPRKGTLFAQVLILCVI